MSAVIKTLTPFIEKSYLLNALESIGISFSEQGDTISIQGIHSTYFRKDLNGKYKLNHYGYNNEIVTKLPQIEQKYIQFYKEHLKELEPKSFDSKFLLTLV